jgi:hypothetical protein
MRDEEYENNHKVERELVPRKTANCHLSNEGANISQ